MSLPHSLLIQQMKEWDELIFGFEFKNLYVATELETQELHYYIVETGSPGTRRAWKGYALRPFEFSVYDRDKNLLLKLKASIKLFWFEMKIYDASDQCIAQIQRKFSLGGKKFEITGSKNGSISGFWFYWKYQFRIQGKNAGIMTQTYCSHLLTRFLLGRSTFRLDFPEDLCDANKLMVLGASFLPEMIYHDRNS